MQFVSWRGQNSYSSYLAVTFVGTILVWNAHADDKGKKSLQALVAAWKERESKVASFDFAVSGKEFKRATTIPEQAMIMVGQVPKSGPLSLPDLTTPVTIRVVSDQSRRARLEYTSTSWSAEKGGYVPQAVTDVFDGKARKLLIPSGWLDYPCASITGDIATQWAADVRFSPIGMVLRPLSMGFFDTAKLVITPNTALVDQQPCLIVTHSQGQDLENRVWVDPARDYVPVRWYEVYRGTTTVSIEIKYSSDPQYGWVPTSWNYAYLLPKGEVRESISCKVTHYEINKPISDDTFDIQFPPGTWVTDTINNETYIVREGGKRRPVVSGEFNGKNYEQLLHSNPPFRGWWTILVIANVAILAAIIGVAVHYKRLKKARVSGANPS
jgi:hypothetical protein